MRFFGRPNDDAAKRRADPPPPASHVPALPATDDPADRLRAAREEAEARAGARRARQIPPGSASRPVRPAPGASGVVDAFAAIGLERRYVDFALRRAGKLHESLATTLRDLGLATGEQIARALAIAHGTEYVEPRRVDDLDLVALRATEVRRRATPQMVPIRVSGNAAVRVAVAEEAVLAGTTVDLATHWHPFEVSAAVASRETLATLWQRLYADSHEAVLAAEAADEDDLAYARNLLEALLRHACFSGCSDLHFTPTERAGLVRLRLDGMLRPYLSASRAMYERLIGTLMNEGSAKELITTREASYPPPADLAGRYGFRVQLTRTIRGIAAVIRVLDRQSAVVEFDTLGFDADAAATIRRWADTAEGLVLVTGPTGSGKTTTLFAVMRLIDGMAHSLHTVENPVELHCPLWHQSQVVSVGDTTEAEAFRVYAKGFLRSDPDQCLVGELRDADTVRAAIDLANTGHLVFGTLHANGAPQTLQRLRELGVEMASISAVLTGVLAQRLIPRLCPHCKTPELKDAHTFEALRDHAGATPYRAVGCPSCDGTGYRGRLLVYELLRVDSELRAAIARGDSHVAFAARIPRRERMWGRGLGLVAAGDTTLAALRSHVEEV